MSTSLHLCPQVLYQLQHCPLYPLPSLLHLCFCQLRLHLLTTHSLYLSPRLLDLHQHCHPFTTFVTTYITAASVPVPLPFPALLLLHHLKWVLCHTVLSPALPEPLHLKPPQDEEYRNYNLLHTWRPAAPQPCSYSLEQMSKSRTTDTPVQLFCARCNTRVVLLRFCCMALGMVGLFVTYENEDTERLSDSQRFLSCQSTTKDETRSLRICLRKLVALTS